MAHQLLVTVAIPTYNRPDLLSRALDSVSKQTYKNLEVLVVDNASPGTSNERVVSEYSSKIAGLSFEKHTENIGAINNFFYCLSKARGDLFMWLADDDELSPTCIEAMVDKFQTNGEVVSVAPHWILMKEKNCAVPMPMHAYENKHWILRALKFALVKDDSLYYGLHKTEVLRKARKVDYWWPNKHNLSNWAYPYLLDMVIAGKVMPVGRGDAQWINHDYTEKSYLPARRGIGQYGAGAIRRINVHAIYASKVYRRGGFFPAVIMSMLACGVLTVELAIFIKCCAKRLMKVKPAQ